ncbi:dispersin export ABC transporter permease subunit AatP [Escherichia coli]|nr:dispersin export ABC transporter permease subunit AatP [Escherichia coli]
MTTLHYYLKEALLNIIENRRQNFAFLVFLSLSFIGIIITDSLIFSVSLKAEEELKVHSDKIIFVKFYRPKTAEYITKKIITVSKVISFSKNAFLYVGDTPFSGEPFLVNGIDKLGLNTGYMGDLSDKYNGNVAIVNESSPFLGKKQIFINGIPFKIIGVRLNSKTDFLDSLGLKVNQSDEHILIPLETMFKMKLDNRVDAVKIFLDNIVTKRDINNVKRVLYDNDIRKFDIVTSLNAKETVDRVLDRFSLLTNSVYVILTLSASVTCFILSKRSFYSRRVELSLKIIHGTEKKEITVLIIVESLIMLSVCLFISIIYAGGILHIIKYFLDVTISIRATMITISLANVLLVFISSNIIFGRLFFSINPVNAIKGKIE